MVEHKSIGYELSISGRNDGTLEALYIRMLTDKVAYTEEVVEDILLADYNKKGELVGIEVLAPVRISKMTKLVDKPQKTSFRKFVKQSAPEELVLA